MEQQKLEIAPVIVAVALANVALLHLPVAPATRAAVVGLEVAAVMGLEIGRRASGWVQDRREDRLNEWPELRTRRMMVRALRNSGPADARRVWVQSGYLGPTARDVLTVAYSALLERSLREALPGGPTAFRLDIIWVQLSAGWLHVSAVLDPFYDLNGLGLSMTQETANVLGVYHGQVLTYSIGGHEFRGPVLVQAVPDHARAIAMARLEATTAGQQPIHQELMRRAEEIMGERRRCVVVPAMALQALLQAGWKVDMS